uniref:Uncharacterized protein n=1 Tax=Mycena chlorophos TaxID=658473 RepID=A0ABQ0L2D8_MYCCL|nr:predicted protein [Mycena chlorophos]
MIEQPHHQRRPGISPTEPLTTATSASDQPDAKHPVAICLPPANAKNEPHNTHIALRPQPSRVPLRPTSPQPTTRRSSFLIPNSASSVRAVLCEPGNVVGNVNKTPSPRTELSRREPNGSPYISQVSLIQNKREPSTLTLSPGYVLLDLQRVFGNNKPPTLSSANRRDLRVSLVSSPGRCNSPTQSARTRRRLRHLESSHNRVAVVESGICEIARLVDLVPRFRWAMTDLVGIGRMVTRTHPRRRSASANEWGLQDAAGLQRLKVSTVVLISVCAKLTRLKECWFCWEAGAVDAERDSAELESFCCCGLAGWDDEVLNGKGSERE